MKHFALVMGIVGAIGCGDDGAGGEGGSGLTGSGASGNGGNAGGAGAEGGSGGAGASGAAGGAGATGGVGAAPTCTPAEPLLYEVDFAGNDGDPWPSPWYSTADSGVAVADLQGGRGRLQPVASSYSLARVFLPGTAVDVEATFTIRFGDVENQGIGFYVRQNGGYVDETGEPPALAGEGYSVFIEGFGTGGGVGLDVWLEEAGGETFISGVPFALQNDTDYRVRYRVTQESPAATRLQARIWAASGPEPAGWAIDMTHGAAHLQGTAGGFAIDAYKATGATVDDVFIDDVRIECAF